MSHKTKKSPTLRTFIVAAMIAITSTPLVVTANDLFDAAVKLPSNTNNGKKIYTTCVVCHGAEGWGQHVGNYPQIAGQLKSVIIKQLADIKSGLRGNPMMYPFTSDRFLPNAQAVSDVAGYISQLLMTANNGAGPGFRLEEGKKDYQQYCADCHGENGEGEAKRQIPALHGQHFNYLMRQFNWIRAGIRKNGDKDMIEQVRDIPERNWMNILDYASRLPPPESKMAKPMWRNPDFSSQHSRR